MNYKMIFYVIGKMLKIVGITIFLPMIIAIFYQENILPYLWTILLFEGCGFLFSIKKPKDSTIFSKEATISIGISWIVISLIGATLFVFSGAMDSYTDAVFEMVSGITTTGSTILSSIETLPKGILFFRNFTNFLGGIGILVFILAVTSGTNANEIYLLRAESAGPNVQKMTNKIRDTAIITCSIYFVLSFFCFISLLIAGLDWFNAITITFATAGTGGLSPVNQSILTYGNVAVEIVCTVFMLIFSVNFSLYFLFCTGKLFKAFKNEEFYTFFGIYFVAVILITLNIMSTVGGFWTALRYSTFEVASSISCCGFANADYNLWPTFSKSLLLLLMMLGGCAGSTAGGLKTIRVVGLAKASKQKVVQTINPRKVLNVKIDGKIQDESYINSLFFYFSIYCFIIVIGTIIFSLDPSLNIGEALSACITTFNNSGPGIGIIGPLDNFSMLLPVTKWFSSFMMLLGRLEIFPIILLCMPSNWKRGKR